MPQHKSEIKSVRSSKKAKLRNKMASSKMKTLIREVLTTKNRKKAQLLLPTAFSIIDKNVKRGIIHKNNAANKKSMLQKKVNALTT